MRRVIVESPYTGYGETPEERLANERENRRYARAAVRDAIDRGESPIASHLLLTQPGILDDNHPGERTLGIAIGLVWISVAQASVVYIDRGISVGMKHGIATANAVGIPIEYRKIPDWK